MESPILGRRGFLRGTLAAAALAPLASCATGGDDATTPTASVPATSAAAAGDNPFGVASASTVEAIIFNGGYGIDYAEFAAGIMGKLSHGAKVTVAPSTKIGQELQPRFVDGTPPDVIDNSGADLIGVSTILDQLEDLTPIIDAKNIEGTTIRDTLYAGVLEPGTFEGKLAVINYVMTVFAVWYSMNLFESNGWVIPKTWDEMYELGVKAKAKDKYLFLWGKEAATYYQELVIASAIKEGGDELRLALDNLKPDAWSHPAMQGVLTSLKKIIDAGFIKPGGSGTQFTAAQAQWSNAQEALLYPSGSWIENEMKSQTKADFKMSGFAAPPLTASPKFPAEALHAAAAEAYIVPSKGKNVAGGKEFMRVMLSKEAATNFAKTKLAPSIVKGVIPADGFGSTALVAQGKMLDNAGENVYTWQFVDFYGMNSDMLVVWNSFLDGKLSVADATAALQKISDDVANDDTRTKIEIK
ncbi:MAG TPA: N-acetylglucosamine/diacetylchitobiose ABC transporter substrate-binding protein [Propionibacteriaceae bacterium]|nr:N-acetylglucosamine/diacetylchitobiose ABC transporter substrate-binding protein [Propionibacteriaceae bacterium]